MRESSTSLHAIYIRAIMVTYKEMTFGVYLNFEFAFIRILFCNCLYSGSQLNLNHRHIGVFFEYAMLWHIACTYEPFSSWWHRLTARRTQLKSVCVVIFDMVSNRSNIFGSNQTDITNIDEHFGVFIYAGQNIMNIQTNLFHRRILNLILERYPMSILQLFWLGVYYQW